MEVDEGSRRTIGEEGAEGGVGVKESVVGVEDM